MRARQIEIGGEYVARVRGQLVPVRVDEIREEPGRNGRSRVRYVVTNMARGDSGIMFRSPNKFRCPATGGKTNALLNDLVAALRPFAELPAGQAVLFEVDIARARAALAKVEAAGRGG